jgi:hypothetical protein
VRFTVLAVVFVGVVAFAASAWWITRGEDKMDPELRAELDAHNHSFQAASFSITYSGVHEDGDDGVEPIDGLALKSGSRMRIGVRWYGVQYAATLDLEDRESVLTCTVSRDMDSCFADRGLLSGVGVAPLVPLMDSFGDSGNRFLTRARRTTQRQVLGIATQCYELEGSHEICLTANGEPLYVQFQMDDDGYTELVAVGVDDAVTAVDLMLPYELIDE